MTEPKGFAKVQAERRTEASMRQAKPGQCRRCGAQILTGDDDDRCSRTVRVDAEPIDPAAEMFETRSTYDLAELRGKGIPAGARALHWRHAFRQRQARNPIHAEHHCKETTT